MRPILEFERVDDIVGWQDFTTTVTKKLCSGNNVALFGPRKTGKSTFTTKLAAKLAAEKNVVPIRINVDTVTSIPLLLNLIHS